MADNKTAAPKRAAATLDAPLTRKRDALLKKIDKLKADVAKLDKVIALLKA